MNSLSNATMNVTSSTPSSSKTSSSTIEHLIMQLKMEYILLSISFAFALLSLIIMFSLRLGQSGKYFVHKQLLISYCAATGFGLLMHDDVRFRILKVKEFCVACVVIYQYLSTTMFAWMFVEGINMVTILFSVSQSISMVNKNRFYAALAWGLPFLTTSLTFSSGFRHYEETTTCYTLATDGIWLWKGPIAFFLSCNTILLLTILSILIRKIYFTKTSQHKKKIWISLRALLVLHPLLGFTFLLGFFLEQNIYIGYVYVAINNVMGILFFVFHIILDGKVRVAFRRDVFGVKPNIISISKDKVSSDVGKWNEKETKRYTAERRGRQLFVSAILSKNVIGIGNQTLESNGL